jgi:hypothetical protein
MPSRRKGHPLLEQTSQALGKQPHGGPREVEVLVPVTMCVHVCVCMCVVWLWFVPPKLTLQCDYHWRGGFGRCWLLRGVMPFSWEGVLFLEGQTRMTWRGGCYRAGWPLGSASSALSPLPSAFQGELEQHEAFTRSSYLNLKFPASQTMRQNSSLYKLPVLGKVLRVCWVVVQTGYVFGKGFSDNSASCILFWLRLLFKIIFLH